MMKTAVLTLLLGLVPMTWAGMYGQPVVNLDAKTFKQVMASEHAAMVAFVAPWCGHCKNLGPEYTSAAQSLTPLIPFYAVDCDESSNKGLCAEYGVQGFPTIKAFPRAGKGAAREYQGERKKGALVEYAKGLVPDRVKKLRADEGAEKIIQSFINEKPDLPHALLIHPSQPSIPFLWKVLGHRLASKMSLGYVRDTTSHAIKSSLGVYDPADTARDPIRAVVWQPGAHRTEVVEYDGEFKFNALLEWLLSQIDGTAPPPQPKKQQPVTPPEPDAKARRQAKLDEAEKRDKARREKAAAQKAGQGGSKVDAPDAVPEEAAEQAVVDSYDQSQGDAAEPVPEKAVDAEATAQRAEQTVVHEEL